MAEFTFFARGDSSSANNASVNSQSLSKTPVTELTFSPASGGDVLLEANGGNPDPDTLVSVDGFVTTFTVEFTGNLPNTSKFSNIDGEDLRGAEIIVITVTDADGDPQRFYFVTDQMLSPATMADFPNGAINIDNFDDTPPPTPICFVTGTLIDTPDGPKRVETLATGDLVSTDLGPRPLLWTGARAVNAAQMAANPALRIVKIAADALAPGQPSVEIYVSANHCIKVASAGMEITVGQHEALVAAKHLVNGRDITWAMPGPRVRLHHLLLSSHRLLTTSGMISESFHPGPEGLKSLTETDSAQVRTALAETTVVEPGIALPRLKAFEARAIAQLQTV